MRRVIVVAHKGENHVYVRGTNGLYKEEVAVLPQMEDLRAKLTEMGYYWPDNSRCSICGGPRPCLRDD